MTLPQKKVLFISYHFPPSGAIGGRRIAAFARYLHEYGFSSHVVTITEDEIDQVDRKGLITLDSVEIHRTGKMVSFRDLYLKSKAALKKKLRKTPSSGGSSGGGSLPDGKKSGGGKLKYFLAALAFLPDEHRNWIIPAVIKSMGVIRREKIDCIVTSCPPYSVHLIGLLVKVMKPDLTWVADFRDPWMVPNEKEIYPTTSFSLGIEYRMERRVMERSDFIVTTTERLARKHSEYYNQLPSDKFVVIPNGFEPDDLPAKSQDKYPVFTVSYTGSLYFGRSPEPLFQAVASLVEGNEISEGAIRIKLVGHCRTINFVPTMEVAAQYGLDSCVEVIDSVPQEESLKIIQRSHIALLLAPNQPYQIPGKTYEYIGLGTPILALTEEGATADLVDSIPTGRSVNPEDVESIKTFILQEMGRQSQPQSADNHDTELYTRRRGSQVLSHYLQKS